MQAFIILFVRLFVFAGNNTHDIWSKSYVYIHETQRGWGLWKKMRLVESKYYKTDLKQKLWTNIARCIEMQRQR